MENLEKEIEKELSDKKLTSPLKDYVKGLGIELGIVNPLMNTPIINKVSDEFLSKQTKEAYCLALGGILSTLFINSFPMFGVGGILALAVIGALALSRADSSNYQYQRTYNDRITEIAGASILGGIITLFTGNEMPLILSFYFSIFRGVDGFVRFLSSDSARKTKIVTDEIKKRLEAPTEPMYPEENFTEKRNKYDI